MEVKVNQFERVKYEIDLDEDGRVMACFREKRIRLVDSAGKHITEAHHRDVISLQELKAAIAKLPS